MGLFVFEINISGAFCDEELCIYSHCWSSCNVVAHVFC